MPVEETKKKHRLFPFHIIRKRSKGKSKSLADLSVSKDEQLKLSQSMRLPKQNSVMNCSFETDESSEVDKDVFKHDKESLDKTSEEYNEHNSEDDEVEEEGEEDNMERILSSFQIDNTEGPMQADIAEISGKNQEQEEELPEFPLGTSVSLAWKTGLCSLFSMEVDIKEGINLIARDRSGTSDPYVKAKFRGKCVYKSKIIRKNLNPVWNEKFSIFFDGVDPILVFKVYDFDRLSSDDQMGVSKLNIGELEINKCHELKLDLINLTGLQEDLGQIVVNVRIVPTEHSESPEFTKKVASRNHVKSASRTRLWEGLLSITLVEGKGLASFDDNGFSDPYCKFKLANEKHRSKVCKMTLNPQWRERFEMKMFADGPQVLEVQVWDKDPGRDEFMGRCSLDISEYEREKTHWIEADLEDKAGTVCFYMTITSTSFPGCESDLANYLEKPHSRKLLEEKFSLWRTLKSANDIGWLQIKLHRAVSLASADIGGASDPFTVIEVNNQRIITPTIYKTLNPQWDKVYEMPVEDIHDIINITVFDEDRRGAPEFLGRVVIPLLSIVPNEKRLYQLKDKNLERQAKGHIIITFDLIYNPIRASLRSFNPREANALYVPPRFRRQLLQQNVDRLSNIIKSVIATGQFVQSLFTWKYKLRSAFAFLLYILLVLNFDWFFLPLILLLILLKNHVVFMLSPDKDGITELDSTSSYDDDEDDDEVDEKNKKTKGKSIREKLEAVTNICTTVQNQLDWIASFGERLKNTFNWSVPFLSYLLMAILLIGTILLYLIPLRYILLAWGVNKFTKKLRKPNAIGNNEFLDFLSRIPSDPELKQRRKLKTDAVVR